IAIAITTAVVARTPSLPLLIASGGGRSPHLGAAVSFLFLAGLFFLFLTRIGAVNLFATLFGRHHFVLVYVGNLRNPTVRFAVIGIEGLFLEDQFFIALYLAQRAKVVGDRMKFHLLVFQNFMLQGTSLGSDGRSFARWEGRRFLGCGFGLVCFGGVGRWEFSALRWGWQFFD